MQKLGPYPTLAVAQLVARQLLNVGQTVQVEEIFEPYNKGNEYQAFVIQIRGEA